MKVLIVDDEIDLCLLLKSYFTRKGYQVAIAYTIAKALDELQSFSPDILFLDNNLPDGVGWEQAAGLLEQHPGLQVHLISAYQPNTPEKVKSSFKVWEKPLTLKDLDNYMGQM